MKHLLSVIAFFLAVGLGSVQAQSTVIFNVNLQPNLEDSAFVPGRDIIRVTGNIYPLSTRPVQLTDADTDSIYTAEIRFTSRYVGEQLEYNFEIVKPNETETERMSRKLNLRSGEMELPALYFNAFAW
ncbi:hypothetical protein [Gracilimonas tropica]|uniref:hypothetical protein n=1 Tax=Gracilimonas tropica TaxID=454600 RepID=UPI000372FF01|nr:hypothetical protein [Gracilimonas tropica]